VADNNVASTGLVKQGWNSIAGLGNNGNGAAPDVLKKPSITPARRTTPRW